MNNSYLTIQMDDAYAKLVGQAVFSFGYYEWMIIYIINSLEPGFVTVYSREEELTSGRLVKRFQTAISQANFPFREVTKTQMEKCQSQFKGLIPKRNALMHGHPITDTDQSQILAFQTSISKPLPDIKWTVDNLFAFINEINDAIIATSQIYHTVVLS